MLIRARFVADKGEGVLGWQDGGVGSSLRACVREVQMTGSAGEGCHVCILRVVAVFACDCSL